MAVFNERYRGYQWTDEEREDRKQKVRQAQSLLDKIKEQVRRIGMQLPAFMGPAQEALEHLRNGLGEVVSLNLSNRGPKYKDLSPEEVDRILDTLPDLIKPWQQVGELPGFASAARQKRKEVQAHNRRVREHNQLVAAQNQALWREMESVLRKVDDGDVDGALDAAAKLGIL